MAKYESPILDKTVRTEDGFITFKNGKFSTTNKKHIKALDNAQNVTKIEAQKAQATIPITPPIAT